MKHSMQIPDNMWAWLEENDPTGNITHQSYLRALLWEKIADECAKKGIRFTSIPSGVSDVVDKKVGKSEYYEQVTNDARFVGRMTWSIEADRKAKFDKLAQEYTLFLCLCNFNASRYKVLQYCVVYDENTLEMDYHHTSRNGKPMYVFRPRVASTRVHI